MIQASSELSRKMREKPTLGVELCQSVSIGWDEGYD
jgi:hypothetical protein